MKITLVGLGVGYDGLTQAAKAALTSGAKVICKTALTKSARDIADLGVEVVWLDHLFKSSRNFDTLYKKLASFVIKESKQSDVVYCVDGNVTEDLSCAIIASKAKEVSVISGVSHALSALSQMGHCGGYTAISAYAADDFISSVLCPLAVYDLDNPYLAREWKLLLTDAFGDEAKATIFIGGIKKQIYLYEMDMQEGYDYSTVLVVHKVHYTQKQRFCVDDLFNVVRALRAPDGCPWDRAQTRESIRKDLLEECYELYDAISKGDIEAITEETGDVLLQVAFHCIFGEENHEYTTSDVVSEICSKLIFRHSHVFGKDRASDDKEALSVWEKNKAVEKGFTCGSDYIKSVPEAFPALMRAQKVQKRAAKYNFDFSSIEQIYGKLSEEITEVKSAEGSALTEEIGDLLFTVVNLARFYGVNSEEALNASTLKFINRFDALEKAVVSDGKNMNELSEEQLDKYYNEIKKS